MDTSREDVGIAIRSAFLKKGTQQRFSLFALTIVSIILLLAETIETKPLNYLRSFIKDAIYRGSVLVSSPSKGFNIIINEVQEHMQLHNNYTQLKKETHEIRRSLSTSSAVH